MLVRHLLNPQSPDALARRSGFPDAATMAAYQQKQQARFNGGTSDGSMPSSVNDAAGYAMALHPITLFNYVLDKWNKATGGQ